MAYNGFPATYQPVYYTPPYQQQPTQPQPQNSGLIWVSGEAGAKAYLVAPNSTVQLWDSEAQVVYLKSADASGMPSLKILDYTVRDTAAPVGVSAPKTVDYATRAETDALAAKIDALRAELDGIKKEAAK